MANFGYAPYEEAAAKGSTRMNLFRAILGGLSSVPRGANFFEGLTAGAGGGLRQSLMAQEAAQSYAMKQMEAQRRAEEDQVQRRYMEALTKRAEKPEGAPTNLLDMTPDQFETYIERQGRLKPPKEPGSPTNILDMTPEQFQLYKQRQLELKASTEKATTTKAPTTTKPKLVTGAERQALAYYNRAKSAEDTISTIENKIAKLSQGQQFQLRYAPNILQTPDQQIYRQSQRAFTEARLRKESGAAIPLHEYESDSKTYFAQPGDSPATVRAKRSARQVVLNGLKFASGRAYDEFYGGAEVETVPDFIYNPETGELEPAR